MRSVLTNFADVPDVPDEVEGSSTPKRSRFDLQSRHLEEEEEEDRSVRRSSRITRYKLNSRNQSVLYNRLITKWGHPQSVKPFSCYCSKNSCSLNIVFCIVVLHCFKHFHWTHIAIDSCCALNVMIIRWLNSSSDCQHGWSSSPEDGWHAEDEAHTKR